MGTMSDETKVSKPAGGYQRRDQDRRRTSNDQIWPENGHTADTNASFGSAICGAEAGEDNGRSATESAEEGLFTTTLGWVVGDRGT